MRCHEVDYEIIGHDMQMVEVELDPGESVVAEAGAMNYMEDGIESQTKMGDGSNPNLGFMGKLFSAGKRAISGESLFMTHFTNNDIAFQRKLGTGFFGGEGLFLATLSGHGTVWLQSLPFSRLADRIIAHAPSAGGKSQGE